jgi:hypothetical protein
MLCQCGAKYYRSWTDTERSGLSNCAMPIGLSDVLGSRQPPVSTLKVFRSFTQPAASFNMTVISLDQTFDPYDVALGNYNSWDWTPNLYAGTRFMVMMNDALGYGRGGTQGPYTVGPSGDKSCLTGGTVTPWVYHTRTSDVATSTSGAIPSTTDAKGSGKLSS